MQFESGDLVTQEKPALLQSEQHQFVNGPIQGQAVDQTVEVGMLDTQFDQPALGRMEVFFHRIGAAECSWGPL